MSAKNSKKSSKRNPKNLHLTCGIYFSLLNEASNAGIQELVKCYIHLFDSKIDLYSPSLPVKISKLSHCESCPSSLPFPPPADELQSIKAKIRSSDQAFLNEFINTIQPYLVNEEKNKWFVNKIIEIICNDELVDESQKFYKDYNNDCVSAKTLNKFNKFNFYHFLIGTILFIMEYSKDNKEGGDTFNELFEKGRNNKEGYCLKDKYKNSNHENSIILVDNIAKETIDNMHPDEQNNQLDENISPEEAKRKKEWFENISKILQPVAEVAEYYSKPWNWGQYRNTNALSEYLNKLNNEFSKIKLKIIKNSDVDFEKLYICNYYDKTPETTSLLDFGKGSDSYKQDIEEDFFLNNEHFLFLGDGGIGKSTFLQNLLVHNIKYYKTYKAIPIHIYSRNFKCNDIINSINFIESFLPNDYTINIYVDALDETNLESRSILLQEIINLIKNKKNIRFFITSRPSEYLNSLKNAINTVYLYSFSKDKIYQYIRNICEINNVDNYLLNEKLGLKEFINNNIRMVSYPLYLILIISIIQQQNELPNSKAKLFETSFNILYRTHDIVNKIYFNRQRISNLTQQEMFKLLCGVGYNSFIEYSYNMNFSRLNSFVESSKSKYNINKNFDTYDLIENLTTAVPILEAVESDFEEGEILYNFIYQTFCEYFAAYYYFNNYDQFLIDIKGFLSDYPVYDDSCSVLPLLIDIYINENSGFDVEKKFMLPIIESVLDICNYSLDTYIKLYYSQIITSDDTKISANENRTRFYLISFLLHYYNFKAPQLEFSSICEAEHINDFREKLPFEEEDAFKSQPDADLDEEYERWLEYQYEHRDMPDYPTIYAIEFNKIIDNKTKYHDIYDAMTNENSDFYKEFNKLIELKNSIEKQ